MALADRGSRTGIRRMGRLRCVRCLTWRLCWDRIERLLAPFGPPVVEILLRLFLQHHSGVKLGLGGRLGGRSGRKCTSGVVQLFLVFLGRERLNRGQSIFDYKDLKILPTEAVRR